MKLQGDWGFLIFSILLSFVLSFSSVFALGINPGVYNIEYSAGWHSFEFHVINRKGYTAQYELELVSNDFGKNVEFNTDSFNLPPFSAGILRGRVFIDDSLKPGENCVRFRVAESSPLRKGAIVARAALIARACIFVPYPGKYIEAKFHQDSAVENSRVYFSATLENKGKKRIEDCKAEVRIYNSSGFLIDDILSNGSFSLSPLETKTLFFKTSSPLKGGIYPAKLILSYDGEREEKEFKLKVGVKDLKFVELPSVLYFKGDVLYFNAKVRSFWNERISDAYLELSLTGLNISSITSSVFSIAGWEVKNVEGVSKVEGLKEGSYEAEFIIHFGNRTKRVKKWIELKEKNSSEDKEKMREIETVSLNNYSIPPLAIIMFLVSALILLYVAIVLTKRQHFNSPDL